MLFIFGSKGEGKYVFIRKQNYVHTQSLIAELMFPCGI